ncbi:hypothetical protein [Roseisalinus antarcticus]|nr:hypothetical protein [Roseisalinus antarcticus]
MLTADLNRDGRVERFQLLDMGDGTVDLQIENTGGGVIYAEELAILSPFGPPPRLDVAPGGSLQVITENDGRGQLTLTIAFRDGDYRVAGVSYGWYDPLDPELGATCDFNLLTGRGRIDRGDEPPSFVPAPWPPMPVAHWTAETFVPPPGCL